MVSAVCASFIATLPAKATSSHATGTTTTSASSTTTGATGINAALPTVIGAAPAGYRQYLENYFQQIATNAGQYGNTGQLAAIVPKAQAAAKLVGVATDKELGMLHFVISELPSAPQLPHLIKRVAKGWLLAERVQQRENLFDQGKLRPNLMHPHDVDSLGCTLLGQWTVDVDVALDALFQLAEIIDSWVADSQLVVILGFGVTSPLSGYKAITVPLVTVTKIAHLIADGVYQTWYTCEEDAHRAELDALFNTAGTGSVQQNTSVKTLAVHATNLGDAYHYQFTVQFEGQPVDPLNETLVALNVPTGGTPTASDITSQVTFVRLDTGVYQFTIPTAAAGTGYRLKVEFDNGQDANGQNLQYFGDTVFTKNTQ